MWLTLRRSRGFQLTVHVAQSRVQLGLEGVLVSSLSLVAADSTHAVETPTFRQTLYLILLPPPFAPANLLHKGNETCTRMDLRFTLPQIR